MQGGHCCLEATIPIASRDVRTLSAVPCFTPTCCFDLETKPESSTSYSCALPKGPGTLLGLTEAGSPHASSPQPSLPLPAFCNPAGTGNLSAPRRGGMLRGAQAGRFGRAGSV